MLRIIELSAKFAVSCNGSQQARHSEKAYRLYYLGRSGRRAKRIHGEHDSGCEHDRFRLNLHKEKFATPRNCVCWQPAACWLPWQQC